MFCFACVEYAGEIKDFWPKKKVTIVHAADQLLNKTYPDKFRKRTEKDITARGIEVVYNDYIDDFSQTGTVTTRNGKKINADLVVSFTTHALMTCIPDMLMVSFIGPHAWKPSCYGVHFHTWLERSQRA